jgi:hypothetical protein
VVVIEVCSNDVLLVVLTLLIVADVGKEQPVRDGIMHTLLVSY